MGNMLAKIKPHSHVMHSKGEQALFVGHAVERTGMSIRSVWRHPLWVEKNSWKES